MYVFFQMYEVRVQYIRRDVRITLKDVHTRTYLYNTAVYYIDIKLVRHADNDNDPVFRKYDKTIRNDSPFAHFDASSYRIRGKARARWDENNANY